MLYLLIVSIIWGFSFGIVKTTFPDVDSASLAFLRLLIAFPCFLIFFRRKELPSAQVGITLVIIGAIQYGLMYLCLFASFQYLKAFEVALLTVFTPLYVIFFNALFQWKKPPFKFWLSAILAVAGALWIFSPKNIPDKVTGIILMQFSNLAFALGQIAWRKIKGHYSRMNDINVYALLYLGGVAITAAVALPNDPVQFTLQFSLVQWVGLLYLGLVASGMAFYFWNVGAASVTPPVLAVFNNLKIPIASIISIFVFHESANWSTLIPGMFVILIALAISHPPKSKTFVKRHRVHN